MAVYGYIRVPAHIHEANHASPDVQLRYITRHAARRGRALDEIFPEKEHACGKPLWDRPQGKRLFSAVRPGDAVVACRLEYLFQSPGEIPLALTHFRRNQTALFLLDLGWEITRGDMTARVFAAVDAAARAKRAQAPGSPAPIPPAAARRVQDFPAEPLSLSAS